MKNNCYSTEFFSFYFTELLLPTIVFSPSLAPPKKNYLNGTSSNFVSHKNSNNLSEVASELHFSNLSKLHMVFYNFSQ